MFGLKFKIPNTYDIVLYKILNNILSEELIYKLGDEEVFKENNTFLFDTDIYSNKDFTKLVSSSKYYPIFLNLQLYKKKATITTINSYDDFLNSSCELILFITDNEYVEIYSKNINYLNIIRNNVTNNKFSDTEIIEDENTIRKLFLDYY